MEIRVCQGSIDDIKAELSDPDDFVSKGVLERETLEERKARYARNKSRLAEIKLQNEAARNETPEERKSRYARNKARIEEIRLQNKAVRDETPEERAARYAGNRSKIQQIRERRLADEANQ